LRWRFALVGPWGVDIAWAFDISVEDKSGALPATSFLTALTFGLDVLG